MKNFRNSSKTLPFRLPRPIPPTSTVRKSPLSRLSGEKAIYLAQAKELGKPEAAIDKIVHGKLEKFYQEHCLLEQSFIKDPNRTIIDILTQKIAKLGENVTIARFTRYQLGQE